MDFGAPVIVASIMTINKVTKASNKLIVNIG